MNERGERRPTKKDKTMKTTTFIAIAVASAFTFASSARAGDALHSPKAQAEAASLKKVASAATSACCSSPADRPAGNARAWEQAHSLKRFAGADGSLNLAHAPRPAYSPKDPRYEAALRANAVSRTEVQVAPLK
jgi:hypothetical protein